MTCEYVGHEVCHWDGNFLYYINGVLQAHGSQAKDVAACSDACFPTYPL